MLGDDMTPTMTGCKQNVLSMLMSDTDDKTNDDYLLLHHNLSENLCWEVHRYLMLKGRQ